MYPCMCVHVCTCVFVGVFESVGQGGEREGGREGGREEGGGQKITNSVILRSSIYHLFGDRVLHWPASSRDLQAQRLKVSITD